MWTMTRILTNKIGSFKMKKFWIIGLSFVFALCTAVPQVAYASFGGGHGGGHGSGTGGVSFHIMLIGLFIGLCQYIHNKWQEKRSEKLEKEIKFKQRYKKDLKKLFVDFQKAWTAGNLDTVKSQMSFSLYEDNQELLKTYAKKEMEPRTVDVFVRNVHVTSIDKDIITVCYEVYARDYFINQFSKKIVDSEGKILKSQRKPDKDHFYEKWSIDLSIPGKYIVRSVKRK